MEFGQHGNLGSGIGPAIARLEAAVFEPDALANALHAAGQQLGFDHFCLSHSDATTLTVVGAEHSVQATEDYNSGGWSAADYRAAAIIAAPPKTLYLDQIMVPDALRLRSEIHNEFFVPHNLAHGAGWRIALAEESWIFALARSEEKGIVRPDEAALLTEFMPYANRTLMLAIEARRRQFQGMVEFADQTGAAALVLDHTGRVGAINQQALRLLGSFFDICDGRLSAAHPASRAKLEALAQAARRSGGPGTLSNFVIETPDGSARLLIRPVAVRGAGLDALPGARILVTFVEAKLRRVAEDDLREVFGLSRAEASVAALLASGKDAQEVADARGVAIGTIRTQIRRLFEKLEVNRLGELIAVTSGFVSSVVDPKDS